MQVTSKKQNFENFSAGRYGNNLRQWSSWGKLHESGYRGSVTMRYNGLGGGGPCIYDLQYAEAWRAKEKWGAQGYDPERIYFNETAPNHKAILQGELHRYAPVGYALHYSTLPLPMRPALQHGAQNHLGPGALLILKVRMSPSSYADLQAALDLWPDATFEISIFSVNVGSLPGRNSIIWEVRNY
jgi:hypothetical protein